MTFHAGVLAAYADLPGWAQTGVKVALVVALGWLVIRFGTKLVMAALDRGRILDQTLRVFLRRLVKSAAYVVLVVVVLNILGVDLTALMGGLAVGGFIVGFALKDALGNLAAGVVLLIYRPFNVGDVVEIGGFTGTVLALGISLTTLRRPDGVIVNLPNGAVLGGAIVNFTRAAKRRATIVVSIEQDDDIDAAVRALHDAVRAHPAVLADPAPEVVVTNLTEDGVDLEVRAWAMNADFGVVINALRPLAKRALADAGLRLARRELVVHQQGAEPSRPR